MHVVVKMHVPQVAVLPAMKGFSVALAQPYASHISDICAMSR
jgi:hypothetical protein